MADFSFRQSEIQEWKQCRRRTNWNYWQTYGEKINREPGVADLGTLVHLGLEEFYGLQLAEPDGKTDDRLARWTLALETADQAHAKMAEVMVRGYKDWVAETGADAGLTILGVEQEISVVWPNKILGCEVELHGKIDVDAVDEFGLPRGLDHKTVQTFGEKPPPMDDQRMTYNVLRWLKLGAPYTSFAHNRLRKVLRTGAAKPPFYERLPKTFSPTQLQSHFIHIEGILQEMVGARLLLAERQPGSQEHDNLEHLLLYPNPTRDCSWRCQFYVLCPMRDDGSDWVSFRNENYDGPVIISTEEESSES